MTAVISPRPFLISPTARLAGCGRWAGTRIAVLVALIVIAVVDLVNVGGYPRFWDDEGTYYSQAWAVNHLDALAPYHYFYDHPPLGWVQLGLFSWIPGVLLPHAASLTWARVVMVGYAVVTAALIYVLARRLDLRPVFAVAAMMLWALSPLTVYESRQVLLDNLILPWVLGAFILAASRSHNIWHHTSAGLVFGVACLSKETIFVIFPALLYTIYRSSYRPTRAFSLLGCCLTTGLCGLTYLLYAGLRNELLPGPDHVSLIGSLQYQLATRTGSGFLLAPGSGAYGDLLQWLSYDKFLIYGGVLATATGLSLSKLRPVALAMVLLAAMALRPHGYLPGMYVIAVLPFCALLIAGLGDYFYSWARRLDVGKTARRGRARPILAGAYVLGLFALASIWIPRLSEEWTKHDNGFHSQVVAWTASHVPHNALIVTDNTFWNDMIRAGWSSDGFDGVVWYNKVDSDPEFLVKHPDGAHAIQYILWDSTMSDDPTGVPLVRQAEAHSRVLATFGTGQNALQIRQVVYP